MSSDSLRATLARVAEWERHHVSVIPEPVKRDLSTLESRVADWITSFAGSMRFVYLHSLWFGVWVVLNLGLIAAVGLAALQPFDPFPFGLLTMIVSLEAIFLSTFVMISQNRQAEVADRRAELDYKVNLRAEAEICKLIAMMEALVTHHVELVAPAEGVTVAAEAAPEPGS